MEMRRSRGNQGHFGTGFKSVILTLFAVLVAAAFTAVQNAGEPGGIALNLEVDAGRHARSDSVVSFAIPEDFRPVRMLETTSGRSVEIPFQVDEESPRRLYWVLSGRSEAGATRTFRVDQEGSPAPQAPRLTLEDRPNAYLEIRNGDRTVLRYNSGMVPPPHTDIPGIQTRNAYIHPVWTPSGRVITMDYPADHLHHRGIWFPWTRTEFEGRTPDFWNLGDGTGTVRYLRHESIQFGPVFASFRSYHSHVDLSVPGGEKEALKENWTVRVWAPTGSSDSYFLFDLVSHQEAAGASPLKLPEYRYGGLGFRGPDEWIEGAVEFLTSEGKARQDGHGTRARWCRISGRVDGAPAGVVLFCHPGNFRAPQPMRIHPSEPFFNWAPTQLGEMEIAPGQPYVSSYRLLVFDGHLDPETIEGFWNDYAEPPSVRQR